MPKHRCTWSSKRMRINTTGKSSGWITRSGNFSLFFLLPTICKNTLTREEKLRKRSTRINYAKAIYTLRNTYLFRYIDVICNKLQVSLLHVSRLYNTFRCISRFDATIKIDIMGQRLESSHLSCRDPPLFYLLILFSL